MTTQAVRPRSGLPPAEWLERITAYLLENQLVDASLRQLALVAGTSHSQLCYYFGSRDGVLAAVLESLRQCESDQFVWEAPDRRTAMTRAWAYFTHPDHSMEMKVLFHLSGQAVHQPDLQAAFGDGGAHVWVAALTYLGEREGGSAADARIDATLLLAAARGLALELLLGGDPRSVDAAFSTLLDRVLPA